MEEVDTEKVVEEVMGKLVENVVNGGVEMEVAASENINQRNQPLPSDEGDGEDGERVDTGDIDDLDETLNVPPAELAGGSHESVIIPNPQQPPFSQDGTRGFDDQSLGGLTQVPPGSQDFFEMSQAGPPLPGMNNHVQPKTQRVAHAPKQ